MPPQSTIIDLELEKNSNFGGEKFGGNLRQEFIRPQKINRISLQTPGLNENVNQNKTIQTSVINK